MAACSCDYTIRLLDPYGNYLFDLDWTSFTLERTKNEIGRLEVILPLGDKDLAILTTCDNRAEVYCDNRLIGETVFFLTKATLSFDSECNVTATLEFEDTIGLLARRVVAWLNQEVPNYVSTMLESLDDIIKLIFFYNFREGVSDPALANTFWSPLWTPSSPFAANPVPDFWLLQIYGGDADNRQMPIRMERPLRASQNSETHQVSFENVLVAMQKVAEQAGSLGESIWFDIVYTPATVTQPADFLFKTWVGVRGVDRSTGTGTIALSPENRNISDLTIVGDYTDSVCKVYALGQGENELRDVESAEGNCCDSPFGTKEGVVSASNNDKLDALRSEAEAELFARRPIVTVDGQLVNVPGLTFGVDYNYGDLLLFDYLNIRSSVEISSFTLNVDADGEEVNVPMSVVF